MNNEESKQALKTAILEWRKKYGVQDGDPLLAAVELWEIYFTHAKLTGVTERLPSFEEFRSTLEQLERLAADLTGRTSDLVQELRIVPRVRTDLNQFPIFALVFTSTLALVTGVLIGHFFP